MDSESCRGSIGWEDLANFYMTVHGHDDTSNSDAGGGVGFGGVQEGALSNFNSSSNRAGRDSASRDNFYRYGEKLSDHSNTITRLVVVSDAPQMVKSHNVST